MKRLEPETAATLALIHEAALSKLAREPVALDVREVTTMTDVLYICHGESGRSADAVARSILAALKGAGWKKVATEGLDALQWILIDLGSIMIHVFLEERRSFYSLEKLWHDGRRVELEQP